ncbi:hypothetical protein N9917_04400 [Deltaproteobacteria bacterium]|nr:hypothetical protein [Deltaproteobacteria bacterium]
MSIFTALGIALILPLSCQAFLYWKVVVTGPDRNHITGTTLLILGLIPIIGLSPLMETYNKDRQPRQHAEPDGPSVRAVPPPPKNKVYTVQQRRDQLLIDPEQVIQDYLDDNSHLGDLGLDDLDTMDS